MDKYFYRITRNFAEPSDPEDYTIFTIEKKLTSNVEECFNEALKFKAEHQKSYFMMDGGNQIFYDEALLSEYANPFLVKTGFVIISNVSEKEWYEFDFAVISQEYWGK